MTALQGRWSVCPVFFSHPNKTTELCARFACCKMLIHGSYWAVKETVWMEKITWLMKTIAGKYFLFSQEQILANSCMFDHNYIILDENGQFSWEDEMSSYTVSKRWHIVMCKYCVSAGMLRPGGYLMQAVSLGVRLCNVSLAYWHFDALLLTASFAAIRPVSEFFKDFSLPGAFGETRHNPCKSFVAWTEARRGKLHLFSEASSSCIQRFCLITCSRAISPDPHSSQSPDIMGRWTVALRGP